ncbi:MAG: hypothetical protein JXR89_02635 [Deltaproteobacteria bacterium]|nr:hypothetical protein [Deltaproteobacteria bacterium]
MKLAAVFILFSFATAYAGLSLPQRIESEFTQYPGSNVIHTIAAEGMVQVVLHCGKVKIGTVFDYYKNKADNSGWDVTMEIKNSDACQLMLSKKGQNGMIAVTDDDGEISVAISIIE